MDAMDYFDLFKKCSNQNFQKKKIFKYLCEKNKSSYIPGGAFSAPGVFQQCCGAINWGCWGCWCCCCTGICCGAVNAVGWGAVEVWEREKKSVKLIEVYFRKISVCHILLQISNSRYLYIVYAMLFTMQIKLDSI